MSEKREEATTVERSRLTFLLGAAAAAGSGGCYALSPALEQENARVSSGRARAPAASTASTPPSATTSTTGSRDPAGSGNGSDGGGGGGGY